MGQLFSTETIAEAMQLIYQFGWGMFFDYIEIYPGSKTTHFNK